MHTTEYDEVEQHRALATLPDAPQGKPALSPDATGMDGEEAKVLGRTMKGYPDFGHGMSKYWKFNKDCESLSMLLDRADISGQSESRSAESSVLAGADVQEATAHHPSPSSKPCANCPTRSNRSRICS